MSALLLPLKLLLVALDFLIMAVTFGWVRALKKLLSPDPLRSVPVGDDPSHRVQSDYRDGLMERPRPGVDTLYDLARDSFERYGPRNAMGTREFLGQKSAKVKEFGGIRWRTYEEVGGDVTRFGAALRAAGLVPAPAKCTLDAFEGPCSLAIFENTCAEWMIAAQGAFSQSVVVTTIYATLGIDAVVEAVTQGVISAIVCNKSNVGLLASRIKDMPTLKTIIYTGDMVAPDSKIDLPPSPKGVKVIAFDDFVASGDTKAFPPAPPSRSTCAVIMYTSGSTGKPKGVVITHGNVVSTIAAGALAMQLREGSETYLAYLPLAHILEMVFEFGALSLGCAVCYADPKTLTASGAYPQGALEQFSPTLMAGVPKIWDVIKKGVEAKVAKSSTLAKFLVDTAFEARTFAMRNGYDTPLFNALVFGKFSKVVGGELRLALSGGGPLNEEVQTFVRTCFGIPLIQGYGLTETCAATAIQDPQDVRSGIAGYPVACTEIKLESCPDITDKAGLPYLSTDTRDVEGNSVYGRGEIVVRGTGLSMGYYMSPEKTKEVYDDDGFFHTGDIGQFMEDGSVRIVDRKKNLVKLKGGEYVAIEKMEMAYGNSRFVDAVSGGICCYGDGDMDRPIALLTLSESEAMKWAKENGVGGEYDKVRESRELHDAVLADMKSEAAKAGLSRIERIVAVSLLTEPWTPENGCLTAANKLQRRVVIEKFEKEFNETKKKGIF